jgi:hypothetical protein
MCLIVIVCVFGCQASGDDAKPNGSEIAALPIAVLFPPDHEAVTTGSLTVTLEQVDSAVARHFRAEPDKWRSRGLMKTLIERTVRVGSSPKQLVEVHYDPSELDPADAFVLSARIDDADGLSFASDGFVFPFGGNGRPSDPIVAPVEIKVWPIKKTSLKDRATRRNRVP